MNVVLCLLEVPVSVKVTSVTVPLHSAKTLKVLEGKRQ